MGAFQNEQELFDYFGGRDAASDYLRRCLVNQKNTRGIKKRTC